MQPPSAVNGAVVPKIELHVHLEGAVRAHDLLAIARRNGVPLPADSVEDLEQLYRFTDFSHFIEMWLLTTSVIRTDRDFRQVVTGYASEASAMGAVYVEAIFTPVERVEGGASWDEVFTGFCDGIAEARELFGVEMRLTPDIPRTFDMDTAMRTARYAVKYRDRGVVGIGLGGREEGFPPEPFERAFRLARDGGVGSVPHAGEVVGAESVRGAVEALGADRIRHGIRAVEDPGLLRDMSDRGIVCDVCPVSNLRTGAVRDLGAHPLRAMTDAGVACSINTDDPAMFDTDLEREHVVARSLGCSSETAFHAGVRGALCDEVTRSRLEHIGASTEWSEVTC